MGNTFKGSRKAEKKYHKKKRQIALESENKSTRLKIVFIGLLALLPLFLIIMVYFSFQGKHNAMAPDLNDSKSAKTRIAEIERVAAMREQMLSQFEEKLKKLQNTLDKEKESKNGLRVVLLSKVAVVDELKEKLKIAQSDHLSLKNEMAKSKNRIRVKLTSKDAVVDELKQKLKIAQSDHLSLTDEIATRNEQIRGLQTQVADLEKEKALAENKKTQFEASYKAVASDHKELESAKARIAEVERVAAMKEQLLSQFEEKLNKLQSNLDKEKKSKNELRVKLTSKDAVVDELKEKLKIAQSDHLSLTDEIANRNEQIRGFQTQVADLEKEKALAENKKTQFEASYKAVASDHKELESAKARIAEVERVAAMKEQLLSQFEEKLNKLQSNLDKEKKSKNELRVKLTSKDAVVDELKEKLKISQSEHLSLKDEIAKSNGQIKELQTQVADLEKEKALAEAIPKVVQVDKSRPQTASPVILQTNAEPGNSNPQADALTLTSQTTDAAMTIPSEEKATQELQEPGDDLSISVRSSQDTDLTNSTKPTATSEGGAFREEAESPNPTAIIDWLIKKHSK